MLTYLVEWKWNQRGERGLKYLWSNRVLSKLFSNNFPCFYYNIYEIKYVEIKFRLEDSMNHWISFLLDWYTNLKWLSNECGWKEKIR